VLVYHARHGHFVEEYILLGVYSMDQCSFEVVAIHDTHLHVAVDAVLRIDVLHLSIELFIQEMNSYLRLGCLPLATEDCLCVILQHDLQRPCFQLLRVVFQQRKIALVDLGVK